jgi:hypothetical protein
LKEKINFLKRSKEAEYFRKDRYEKKKEKRINETVV